jgi:hypothetical protein
LAALLHLSPKTHFQQPMLNLYKKSILALLEMLHAARIRPYDNVGKWLLIQETLVRRIIYVENRIRISKNKVTELNKQRKNPQARLSKEEPHQLSTG